MSETTFNWRMLKQVFTECHVYDEVRLGWVGGGGFAVRRCAVVRCAGRVWPCRACLAPPLQPLGGAGTPNPLSQPHALSYPTSTLSPVLQEHNYVPFDYKKEEPLLAWQRKVLPDTM